MSRNRPLTTAEREAILRNPGLGWDAGTMREARDGRDADLRAAATPFTAAPRVPPCAADDWHSMIGDARDPNGREDRPWIIIGYGAIGIFSFWLGWLAGVLS